MRSSHFRPGFDIMDRRITPSDVSPIPITPPADSSAPSSSFGSQDFTNPQLPPATWFTTGTPPPTGGDFTNPQLPPLTYIGANQ